MTGDDALTWVRERNADEHAGAGRDRGLQGARRAPAQDPRLRRRAFPYVDEDRRALLQLLARREEPARPVAAHHARRVPQGRADVGDRARPRRARQGRERELGLARRRLPASPTTTAAWSRSRAAAPTPTSCASSTSTTQGLRQGRLQRCPRPRASVGWIDADTLFVGTDFGPGSLTDVGLPAHRQGVEARHAARATRAIVYEGKADDVVAFGVPRPHQGLRARLRLPRASPSTPTRLFLRARRQAGPRSTSPTTPNASVHREWLLPAAAHRLDASAARPTPPGSLLAADFERLPGRQARVRRAVRADRAHARSPAISPTRNHVILNVLDNVHEPALRADARGRQVDARAAARRARVRHASASPRSTPTSRDDYFLTVDRLPDADHALRSARVGKGRAETLKQPPAFFDADGLVGRPSTRRPRRTARRCRTSRSRRKDLDARRQQPDAALRLRRLRGLADARLQRRSSARPGSSRAACYVVANIRGGGEFGPTLAPGRAQGRTATGPTRTSPRSPRT